MKREAKQGDRVYEYIDADGVVYYSFTRHKSTLSPTVRLRLKSRIGVHLINFLSVLRQRGSELQAEEDSSG